MQVITLVDGSFVYGAYALISSLRCNGFCGEIIVGCTRPLPQEFNRLSITQRLLPPSDFSLMNRKAELILGACRKEFLYIDADCVVDRPGWVNDVQSMIKDGMLLTVEAILPSKDVRRSRWRARSGGCSLGRTASDRHGEYYNAGFFGGTMERDADFLRKWREMITTILPPPGDTMQDPDFRCSDQDVLNLLITQEDHPIVALCPPDVFFSNSPASPFLKVGYFNSPILIHGTGGPKPWQLTSVPPRPPDLYERRWLFYAPQDAVPVSRGLVTWMRAGLASRGLVRAARARNRVEAFAAGARLREH